MNEDVREEPEMHTLQSFDVYMSNKSIACVPADIAYLDGMHNTTLPRVLLLLLLGYSQSRCHSDFLRPFL